jgi:hypothetical protein
LPLWVHICQEGKDTELSALVLDSSVIRIHFEDEMVRILVISVVVIYKYNNDARLIFGYGSTIETKDNAIRCNDIQLSAFQAIASTMYQTDGGCETRLALIARSSTNPR